MRKHVISMMTVLLLAAVASAFAVPGPRWADVDKQDKTLLNRQDNPSAVVVPKSHALETRFSGALSLVPEQLRGQAGQWSARQSDLSASSSAATVWVDDNWVGTPNGTPVGGHIFGTDAFATIQDGIDNVLSGGTVNVYPGNYNETAAGRLVLGVSGPYQFGLFIATYKSGITVQGITAGGSPITSFGGVVANVQTNATNGFGPSGVFVEGDNVAITGLNIYQNSALGLNKTVEVIGDAFTLKYCRLTDGMSLYFNDWRYDTGTNTSWIKSYNIDGNEFTLGTSVDIASGAGYSGPVSGRKIVNNSFDLDGGDWNAISFNGSGTGVPWFVYSVGGAIITGNSFVDGSPQYIRARGDYDNSQFDWQTYFNSNTFDRKVVVVNGGLWANGVREYSYTSGSYTFNHSRRIGSTIQDEIAHAATGDEILVGDGTYAENVVIDKEVKLTGSGAAGCKVIPAVSAPNPGGASSLAPGSSHLMLVQASNVTISGLTLDGDNPSLTSGVTSNGIDVDARNGIITNHAAGVYQNLTVHHTTVKNIYLRGMYASSGGTFWFHHNTVQNVNGEYASIGMFNFGGAGTFEFNTLSDCNDAIASNWSKGCQFLNNTVSNSGSGVHTDNAGNYAGSVADLIKGNVISNSALYGYGIFVFAPYIAPTVTENTITNCDVGFSCAGAYAAVTPLFTNNVINGMAKANSTGLYITTQIWGYTPGNCTVTLSGNQILNNVDGAYFEADAGYTCTVSAQNNTLSGNSNTGALKATGTYGAGTFALNMTSNWWGAVSGPINATTNPAGAGNSVDDGIKYSPWVASSGTDSDLGTIGWQPDLHFVGVSTNGTIQEGVNLVVGSTVYVAAGTYAGQVVMSGFADLKLIGAGVGSTIVTAPASPMTHYFMTGSNKNYAILSVEDCASTKISHLTVDGLGKGNSNYRFVGIGYRNSGGAVDTCVVLNIKDTPFSGAQHGVGIYAFADNGTNRTLVVNGTLVSGFQKTGLALSGVNLSAAVNHCTVTGAGPTTVTAQNGIQIGPDASGSMSYNAVSAISYTGPSYAASGLLAWGPSAVNADHNTVTNAHAAAYWSDAPGSFTENNITQSFAGTGHHELYGFLGVHSTTGAMAKVKPDVFDLDVARDRRVGGSSAPHTNTLMVSGNTFDGAGADTSFGIYEYAYGTSLVNITIDNNHITNYLEGVVLYEDGASASITATMDDNILMSNELGLDNYGSSASVERNTFANTTNASDNASGNYYNQNCWHDYSGSGAYAVGGGGGNADNNPNSNCGLNMTGDTIAYNCSGSFQLTYSVGEIVQALDYIRVKLEFPAELTPGTPVVLNANYSLLPTAPPTNHGAGQKDTMQVEMIVLSGAQDGPASLFRIPFSATTGPAYPSYITEIDHLLRDSNNVTLIVPPASPTVLLADCATPTIVVNSPASGGYYNTAPVLNLTATDNLSVAAVYYQIDACTGAGWQVLATGLSGTSYNNPAWTVPGFGPLSEANHCIRFKVVDISGHTNADTCSYNWCFTKDVTPPVPPTNLVAKPGHNKVHLTWTNSSSSDVVGVRFQRVPWTDYPEYGSQPTPTAAPVYPATYTVGTMVFDSGASASTPAAHNDLSGLSNATRDIYYYGAFAYDAAGNYSIAAVSAQARSTSYWLGDIADNFITPGTYDGLVYFPDLNFFSLAYGKKWSDAGFRPDADFGPTHNSSPKGIPMPDDSINFEDAIIFAINFDAVTPSGKIVPLFTQTPIDGAFGLSLDPDQTGTWHLRLNNNPGTVKGLHAVVTLPAGAEVQSIAFAESVKANEAAFFTWIGKEESRLVIDLAVLGHETTIGGSGDLATLRISTTDGQRPELSLGDIRDIENRTITTALVNASGLIPSEFSLSQNYPNPFNPTTTISFALPTGGHVKIDVFNVLGQQVTTLVDESRPAGSYTVEWNSHDKAGRPVASGVYLYRLTTDGFTATRKMTLLK